MQLDSPLPANLGRYLSASAFGGVGLQVTSVPDLSACGARDPNTKPALFNTDEVPVLREESGHECPSLTKDLAPVDIHQ